MVLSTTQSWLFLAAVFILIILAIWIGTRPTRETARRARRQAEDLDELVRLEKSRRALQRMYDTDGGRTRIGHTDRGTDERP